MSHPRGFYYLGSLDISETNKSCLPWINTTLVPDLPDEETASARNYCRFLPGHNWIRPSCIVSTVGDYHIIEECNIPYCGGRWLPQ